MEQLHDGGARTGTSAIPREAIAITRNYKVL